MSFISLFIQVINQPWSLVIAIGLAAFLIGMLIPKKNGSSWLSGIVFFLPNLVLDLLDIVHTKKFKYYGLITALLAIEAFFAFRAATVYYDVLHTRMPGPEMTIVCVIVFVAIFLCGYMVATHGKLTFWSGCTMAFVIIHDWAGTVWMNYSVAATSTTNASIDTPNDPLKVLLTIGMCVLGLLPFIMGHWVEELRPQLEEEMEEEVDTFTNTATRKIKRRAVEKVLRMANHTDVVRLVQALPASEFTEFKNFVMPIIAPGQSHNLPEENEASGALAVDSQQNGNQETGQNGVLKTAKVASPNRQSGGVAGGQNGKVSPDKMASETRQFGKQNPAKVADKNQTTRQDPSGQNGNPATGNLSDEGSAKWQSENRQNGSLQVATRDAKIRQFSDTHPGFTHAKLAKRFNVSERTIARALSPQTRNTDELVAIAKPSTNGHHKDRDTEELAQVSLTEEEVVFSQN